MVSHMFIMYFNSLCGIWTSPSEGKLGVVFLVIWGLNQSSRGGFTVAPSEKACSL